MDDVLVAEMSKGFSVVRTCCSGRHTYEQFYGFWPDQTDGNPFTEVLDPARKYVVSRAGREPLPW